MPAAAHAPRSLPARYPPSGVWPAEMRIDMAAAYFDYETTGKLYKAIQRGEAPRPTATRLEKGRHIPVWALDACFKFVANRHEIRSDGNGNTGSIADDI